MKYIFAVILVISFIFESFTEEAFEKKEDFSNNNFSDPWNKINVGGKKYHQIGRKYTNSVENILNWLYNIVIRSLPYAIFQYSMIFLWLVIVLLVSFFFGFSPEEMLDNFPFLDFFSSL